MLTLERTAAETRRIERLEKRIDELDERIGVLCDAGGDTNWSRVAKLVKKRRSAMSEWNRLTWPRPI